MIKTFNEIADYKEIITPKSETITKKPIYKAYCNSERCGGERIDYKLAILKNVPISTVFCLDCGYALFWCDNLTTNTKKYGVESRQNQGGEKFRGSCRNAMLPLRKRRRKLQPTDSAA